MSSNAQKRARKQAFEAREKARQEQEERERQEAEEARLAAIREEEERAARLREKEELARQRAEEERQERIRISQEREAQEAADNKRVHNPYSTTVVVRPIGMTALKVTPMDDVKIDPHPAPAGTPARNRFGMVTNRPRTSNVEEL